MKVNTDSVEIPEGYELLTYLRKKKSLTGRENISQAARLRHQEERLKKRTREQEQETLKSELKKKLFEIEKLKALIENPDKNSKLPNEQEEDHSFSTKALIKEGKVIFYN